MTSITHPQLIWIRASGHLCWGLVPFWAKEEKIAFSTINAMAETVATKPAFRDAWKRGQRCVVPLDGLPVWLGEAAADAEAASSLLRPCPDEWLSLVPVYPRMGNVKNQAAEFCHPISVQTA